MKSFTVIALLTLLSSCVSSQQGSQPTPLQTVSHVDLQRYVGLWHDLGREYEYAVVGTPNGRYLWILSRTPEMHPDILEKVAQNVEKQGFVRSNILLHNKENLL